MNAFYWRRGVTYAAGADAADAAAGGSAMLDCSRFVTTLAHDVRRRMTDVAVHVDDGNPTV